MSQDNAARQQGAGPSKDCGCGGYTMPKVTFSTFAMSLCSSAMVHLGECPDPDSGQTRENLDLARHTIDILSMLKDKTSGCLDESEVRLLDDILYELRLKYVAKTS
jgi:hypothetical protein